MSRLLLLAGATAAAVAALAATTPHAASRPLVPADLAPVIRELVHDSAATASLVFHLDSAATLSARRVADASGADVASARAAIVREIAGNLAEKQAAGFPISADDLRRTVVDYECWKAQTYVSAGVFPKRYFGYLDGKWDTAEREAQLRETAHAAVAVVNDWQRARGAKVRLSDAEVVVTFLAEGGAALLVEPEAMRHLDDIHPVFGIGMDDIGSGLSKYPELAAKLDAIHGTGLAGVARMDGGPFHGATIGRNLTFREAILGTALMLLDEKELAEQKLLARDHVELQDLPADQRFVVTSLYYNAGRLFDASTVDEIRTFSTGEYLARLNRKASSRPLLPVGAPGDSARWLLADGYPGQETSWSAVYHVLQRYGAYVALHRFTNDFGDDDMLR